MFTKEFIEDQYVSTRINMIDPVDPVDPPRLIPYLLDVLHRRVDLECRRDGLAPFNAEVVVIEAANKRAA